MQFVDVVGQQMRPLQALPAPNRIVHVKGHVPSAALPPAQGGQRAPSPLCRQALTPLCWRRHGNSTWNRSLQSFLRLFQEPLAGIAVELTRAGAGQAQRHDPFGCISGTRERMPAIGGALARRGGADEVARAGIVLAAAFRPRRAVSPQADAFRRHPRGPDDRLGDARPCICPASILQTSSFDTPPTVSRWPDLPVIPRARRRGAGWPSDGGIARRYFNASVRRRRRRDGEPRNPADAAPLSPRAARSAIGNVAIRPTRRDPSYRSRPT
jgi:hypothetical protein